MEQNWNARIVSVANPNVVEVSSTQIRESLQQGENGMYLDESIWGYILMHRLYGTHADLKKLSLPQLRAASYIAGGQLLHGKGQAHSSYQGNRGDRRQDGAALGSR